MSQNEEKVIEFVSKKLANGKRVHELELMKRLFYYDHGLLAKLRQVLSEEYQRPMDENCAQNIINIMTKVFLRMLLKKHIHSVYFWRKKRMTIEKQSFLEKC